MKSDDDDNDADPCDQFYKKCFLLREPCFKEAVEAKSSFFLLFVQSVVTAELMLSLFLLYSNSFSVASQHRLWTSSAFPQRASCNSSNRVNLSFLF